VRVRWRVSSADLGCVFVFVTPSPKLSTVFFSARRPPARRAYPPLGFGVNPALTKKLLSHSPCLLYFSFCFCSSSLLSSLLSLFYFYAMQIRVESSGSRADWPSARCSRRSCRRRSARRAARRGRSQSSGRRARCGQRVRSAQTAEEMQRRRTRKRTPIDTTKHTKQGGHSKQHGR